MKVLHLTLKKKWFDMIASGEKKEEYREIKAYWIKRLLCEIGQTCQFFGQEAKLSIPKEYFKQFDFIRFRNGYAANAPVLIFKFTDITIGKGKLDWGAEDGKEYFIINLR